MVNHVRTLLLNENPASLAPYTTIWVDPLFVPVVLPSGIRETYNIVIPPSMTIAEKVLLVDAMMVLLHQGELEPYVLGFDCRVTYLDAPSATLADFLTTQGQASLISQVVQAVDQTAVIGTYGAQLFDLPKFQTDLTNLRTIWSGNQEGTLRFGSLLLALAYQIDNLR